MKLLLVDDNRLLGSRLAQALGASYCIEVATSGKEALAIASRVEWSAILLDLKLPDINGMVVCRRLRELHMRTPILIITGDDRLATKVSLFKAGADDYITKPFHIDELKARIAALLRRPPLQKDQPLLTWRGIVLDPVQRSVTRDSRLVMLRRKEFDILEYLMRHPDQAVSRQTLFHNVWPLDTNSTPSVVDIHIKRLRDTIDRPFAVPVIKTVYGAGYRLV